jgi:hypothetical protein
MNDSSVSTRPLESKTGTEVKLKVVGGDSNNHPVDPFEAATSLFPAPGPTLLDVE